MHKRPKVKTLMDSVEPWTEAELSQFRRKHLPAWFDRQLEVLFGVAADNPALAKRLCEKVAKEYAAADSLRQYLLEQIKRERVGKPRGRKPTPKYKLAILLFEYDALCQSLSAKAAILTLSEFRSLTAKQIEKKITAARKVLTLDDLAMFVPRDELPAFFRRQKMKTPKPSQLDKNGG